MKVKRFSKVRHAKNGWKGYVYGAGPGRSKSRWNNPQVLYVDWYHRRPATGAHKPDELIFSGHGA